MSQQPPATPLNAEATTLNMMVTGYMAAQMVRAAARLRIAAHLADGPCTLPQLADATGADPDALARFLRASAAFGLIVEPAPGTFEATPLLAALEHDGGWLSDFALAMADPVCVRPAEHYADTVLTGRPSAETALGMGFWEHLDAHPDTAESYAAGLSFGAHHCARAFATRYDLSGYRSVVDVGGGSGAMLSGILQTYPHLRGVLVDRPAALQNAGEALARHGVADRVETAPSDFLESVPSGGDLYLLKSILIDWDDTRAANLLRNVHRAATPGATLILIDWMFTQEPDPQNTFLHVSDFNMLVSTGGRVRTREQFTSLIEEAGFHIERVDGFNDGLTAWSMIEARA
ncbi:methyltransferase [Streptomyces sp. cg2]|uniref:methyltransferase n=1 Tax=Streptomyces sp. cg2 TaxID=3238799 RepID=UPI0034E208B3